MISKNYWKKSECREISVTDLAKKILQSWKLVVCCAVICAVAFGSYKYYKDNNMLKSKAVPMGEQGLTQEEKEGVAYAQALRNFLDVQNTYIEESVLLKINPYQENRVALQYEIHAGNGDDALRLLTQYAFYIENGGAVLDIMTQGENEISAQHLQELIWINELEPAYDMLNNGANKYFSVYVISEDNEKANMLADAVEKALESYSESILTSPEQGLILLSRQDNIIYDATLEQKRNTILENRNFQSNTLNTLVAQFSEAQMAEYDEINYRSEEPEIATVGINVKYVLVGFFLGICLGCCWIVFVYLLSGKIKGTAEIENNYDLCVYGTVRKHVKNEKQKQQDRSQIFAKLLLNCHKNSLEKLVFISEHELDEALKKEYDYFCKEMEKQGIKCTVAENMLSQVEVYEHMGKKDAVVVVVETGKTSYLLFDKMLTFIAENNLPLSGVIVVE